MMDTRSAVLQVLGMNCCSSDGLYQFDRQQAGLSYGEAGPECRTTPAEATVGFIHLKHGEYDTKHVGVAIHRVFERRNNDAQLIHIGEPHLYIVSGSGISFPLALARTTRYQHAPASSRI